MNPRPSYRVVCPFLPILLLAMVVQAGPADPVYIPDPALKQAIKDQLGITHDPNEADMLTLTYLPASGRGIVKLNGLETAPNGTSISHNT